MSGADSIQFVCDQLAQPPYNMTLTMVGLDSKSADELLHLLCEVFAQLSQIFEPPPRGGELRDVAATRASEFLRLIRYRPADPETGQPMDPRALRDLLASGDKDALFAALKWVLTQPAAKMTKQAFVGFYLSEVQVPDEMAHDDGLLPQIRELQAAFVDTHREVEALREATRDPRAIKAEIASLETEKEQLERRTDVAKQKVGAKVAGPALRELQDAATALRKQQEEEMSMRADLQRELEKLEASKAKFQRAAGRLADVRARAQDGAGASASSLLAAVAEEVSTARLLVHDKLPKELERRKAALAAVQNALNSRVETEEDLAAERGRRERLEQEVRALEERQAASRADADDRADQALRQQMQLARAVAKKKEDLHARLDKLTARRDAMHADWERVSGASETAFTGKALGGPKAMAQAAGPSDAERQAKVEAVKSALATYHRQRRVLDSLNNELEVLGRTEAILREQAGALSAQLDAAARRKGIAGYQDTQAALEQVSLAKGAIDEAKGAALEDISGMVTAITAQIKASKDKLQPRIKELREVRARFAELEADYTERKRAFDAATQDVAGRRAALEKDVGEQCAELAREESRLYLLNCQLGILDVAIKRATNAAEAQRLKDKYARRLQAQEEASRALWERQREVKEFFGNNQAQLGMVAELTRLLQCKLALARRGGGGGGGAMNAPVFEGSVAGANVMTF